MAATTASTARKPGAKPGQQPPAAEAKRPPPFKIERVRQRERFIKALIYGQPGAGKTTLAASSALVPSMRDIFMINAESGDLAVPDEWDIDGVGLNNFGGLDPIYKFLRGHCKHRDANNVAALRTNQAYLEGVDESEIADEDIRRYRTVIIDSITEVEAYCFAQLLGLTDNVSIADEPDAAEWSHFRQNLNMMLRLTRQFRDLPMHVIFIVAQQYSQDETKKRKYSPGLTGQLSQKIQGFMDMVGYLVAGRNESGEYASRLYVAPSSNDRYDAKHRYHKFKGQYFDTPDMNSILSQVGLLES